MARDVVTSENRAPWPYAHTAFVRDADLLLCSGQVAFNADMETVGKGDVCAQTRQALENLKGRSRPSPPCPVLLGGTDRLHDDPMTEEDA